MFIDFGNICLVGYSERIEAGVEYDDGGGDRCHEQYEQDEGGN